MVAIRKDRNMPPRWGCGFCFGWDSTKMPRLRRFGVRWHDIAFLDATCRVEPKRGRVRALQNRIPKAALERLFSCIHFGLDDGGNGRLNL